MKKKYVLCYFVGTGKSCYVPLSEVICFCSFDIEDFDVIELTDEEFFELSKKLKNEVKE